MITEINILSDLRIVHDQGKKSQQQNHYKSVPRFADNFYTLATLLQDMEINGLHVKPYLSELWWSPFMKWLGTVLEHWGRTGCGLTSSPDLDIGTDPDLGTVRGNRGCPSVINTCHNSYIFFKNQEVKVL